MALSIAVGQSMTRTITAGYPDPASPGGTPLVDPNATVVVTEGSNGAVLELVNPVSNKGVATVEYKGIASGSSTVTATATDPDGHVVTATEDVTVTAVQASTDATEITFS